MTLPVLLPCNTINQVSDGVPVSHLKIPPPVLVILINCPKGSTTLQFTLVGGGVAKVTPVGLSFIIGCGVGVGVGVWVGVGDGVGVWVGVGDGVGVGVSDNVRVEKTITVEVARLLDVRILDENTGLTITNAKSNAIDTIPSGAQSCFHVGHWGLMAA